MVETIATNLRQAGVRPQTPCAFILNNSVEPLVFFLALQWIAAIAVPIDPDLSSEDIDTILKQLNTSIVVSPLVDEDDIETDELYQKVSAICDANQYIHWFISRSTNQGVYLDMNGKRAGDSAAWAGGASDFKYDPNETAFTLAYATDQTCLIVPICHRAGAHATRDYAKMYGLTSDHSMLLVEPFHHINGLMSVLATIYSGGNVVLPPPDPEPSQLLEVCATFKINWMCCSTDTVLELSQNATSSSALKLSFIRTYGANIDPSTLQAVEKSLGAPILEAYGTPETCGLVSGNTVDEKRVGTCGKPVGDSEIAIFDTNSTDLVELETVGRIGIHSAHVSHQYANNEFANRTCYVTLDDHGIEKTFFLPGDTGSLSPDDFLTIASQGKAKNRAAALAEQEEDEIKSHGLIEAQRATALAQEQKEEEEEKEEERRLQEEEEGLRKKEKEEKEARRLAEEEEARREEEEKKEKIKAEEEKAREEEKREEQERQEEEKEAQEKKAGEEATTEVARKLPSLARQESTHSEEAKTSSSEGLEHASVSSAAESPSDNVAVERAAPVIIQQQMVLDPATQEIMKRIMQRLDGIEENQRRLEGEIEAAHRLEIARLRQMLDKMLDTPPTPSAPPTPTVNMDEINSAVRKAAESAQNSSRDTAAAAQAAIEAAEAAKAASASHKANSTSVAEVIDPNAIQKSVMVSLEEVEQAMRSHPAVESARAFGRPDPKFSVEVFCAISPKKGARVSEPWLKLHAQSVLPAAFVPKKFFYKEGLTNEEDREALSEDKELKRVSEISGYSSTKIIKSPAWKSQQGAA